MNLSKKIEQAVLNGDLKILLTLENDQVNWDFRDRYGRTVLFDAIAKSHISIVEFLCNKGINVNVRDYAGKTPLHFASIYQDFEIAQILIRNNADVSLRDNNGNIPLFDAIFNSQGNTDLVALLIANGSDYLSENNHGVSPKELAETISNFDITDLFR